MMYWKGNTLLAELAEISDFNPDMVGGAKGPAPVFLSPGKVMGPATIMPPGYFEPLTGQWNPVQVGVATGVPAPGIPGSGGGQVQKPKPGPSPEFLKAQAKEAAIKKQLDEIAATKAKKEALEAEIAAIKSKSRPNELVGDIRPPSDSKIREERELRRLEAEKKVAEEAREKVRQRGKEAQEKRKQFEEYQQHEAAAAFIEKRTKDYLAINQYDAGASEKAYADLARLKKESDIKNIGKTLAGAAKKGATDLANKPAEDFGKSVADFIQSKFAGPEGAIDFIRNLVASKTKTAGGAP